MKSLRSILFLGIELVVLYLGFQFIASNWGLPETPYGGDGVWFVMVVPFYLMLRIVYSVRKNAVLKDKWAVEILRIFFTVALGAPVIFAVLAVTNAAARNQAVSLKEQATSMLFLLALGLFLIHIGIAKLSAKRTTKTAS